MTFAIDIGNHEGLLKQISTTTYKHPTQKLAPLSTILMSFSLNGTTNIEGGSFNNVSGNMYQVFKFHFCMGELAGNLPDGTAQELPPSTTGAIRAQRRSRRRNIHPYLRPLPTCSSIPDGGWDPQDILNSTRTSTAPRPAGREAGATGSSGSRSSIFKFSNEEDQPLGEPCSWTLNATKMKISKRRQNTLAARRNRQSRLTPLQQQLKASVDLLTRKKQLWKTRALMLSAVVRSHQ
ncbi:hypothetical protein B0H19DRAFT_1231229 [Mycena capillaripes]|nr:hypothetical protein B0H19DRAFT_1231229 [Mycena capillaripes]